MTLTVKICGITNLSDAKAAILAGADYLGFIFVPQSPRSISVTDAKAILASLRSEPIKNELPKKEALKMVGVFQNAKPLEVKQVTLSLKLDFIQLHGEEKIEDYVAIGCPLIRVVQDLQKPFEQNSAVAFYLLDRSKTMRQENWLAEVTRFVQQYANLPPLWLAGGLTLETLEDAMMAMDSNLAFCGVDVASGVEKSPGQKDPDRMKAFCRTVKAAQMMMKGQG